MYFFCATLILTHTYAYNALPLTFTPYPCISLSHAGNIHTNSLKEGHRERKVCVISVCFDFSHAGLSCSLLDSGSHRVEKRSHR